jgi:hypothetical protein
VAEFAACNTGTEGVVADTDGVVLVLVGESVVALGHGTDENADALIRAEVLDVISHTHDLCIKGEGYLAAVGWEMVGDGVLDDLEQLLLRGGRPDGKLVQELNHETREALKGTRDADRWRNFDENALGGMDVDLELASLVYGRVQQGE